MLPMEDGWLSFFGMRYLGKWVIHPLSTKVTVINSANFTFLHEFSNDEGARIV